MEKVLGQGNFGKVWKAAYQGETVAVKELLGNSDVSNFSREADVMRKMTPHRTIALINLLFLANVAKFVGVCLSPLCIGLDRNCNSYY